MRFIFGVLSAAASAVIVVVVYLNVAGTDVVVLNSGASTIRVRGQLPAGGETALTAVGIKLPDELRPGVPTVVRVPRLSGDVAASTSAITVSMLGQSMSFAAHCQSLDLDGTSLLGRQTTFNIGARQRHDLRIACG
jgi:hypothetical protein